jgi:hypothetical protein
MENVGKYYGHLEYIFYVHLINFTAIWYIYSHLVYFTAIGYLLRPYIWYKLSRFGTLFREKSGNGADRSTPSDDLEQWRQQSKGKCRKADRHPPAAAREPPTST